MKYRVNKFYAETAHTADTTVVIPIDITDVISQIILEVQGLNATTTHLAPLTRAITKIDVIDGSDVLFSLDGEEAEALDWYHNKGAFRANYNYQLNGGTCKRFIGLNFGRYLYDPLYALDPKQFKNLQLRVTIDVGVAANTAANVKLTCRACIFESVPAGLRGFIMSKEFKQWTMASAAHNYTDLPLDYPYRALFFRAMLAGTEANQCVSNLKLSEDQDKRIVFDDDPWGLQSVLLPHLPKVKENYFFVFSDSNSYLYIAPSSGVVGSATKWWASASTVAGSLWDGDGGRLMTIASSAGKNFMVHVEGYLPHGVFMLPFGNQDDPEDWYDVRGLGSLKADITGGDAAQGYLFAQQIRSY